TAHVLVPAADRLDGELGRVGRGADRHESLVGSDVVDAVGSHLAQLAGEVVGEYLPRLALGSPFAPAVVVFADESLLLRVDRDAASPFPLTRRSAAPPPGPATPTSTAAPSRIARSSQPALGIRSNRSRMPSTVAASAAILQRSTPPLSAPSNYKP